MLENMGVGRTGRASEQGLTVSDTTSRFWHWLGSRDAGRGGSGWWQPGEKESEE